MNQSQLSTDKLLSSLRPPKQVSKVKKLSSKMNSLALCQVNMMQVLLQKISRKSKVIRKQEKIVHENLKRKRIYLDREKFDIMSVLRQTASASEKGQSNSQKRQQSPATIRCASTTGTQSALANVSSHKAACDDINEDQ